MAGSKPKPLKINDDNEDIPLPTEFDPSDDFVNCKGIVAEDDDNQCIYVDGDGDWGFEDNVTTTFQKFRTLSTGFEFDEAEDLTTSATTSTTFQEKLKLTTMALEGGDYNIFWAFEWQVSGNNNKGEFRVQIDDDAGLIINQFDPRVRGTGYNAASSFGKRTLSAGVHFIDIDFRRVSGTTSIRRARIEIARIQT